jgi:hypothetical protein
MARTSITLHLAPRPLLFSRWIAAVIFVSADQQTRTVAFPRLKRSSDDKTRKERFDDFGAGRVFLFGGMDRNKLILAFETSPELLNLVGVEAFFPVEIDQT